MTVNTIIQPDTRLREDDTGNADRFVTQHSGNVRFIHSWKKWLVWDDFCWREDKDDRIYRLAKTTVRNIYQESANAAMNGDDNAAKILSAWAKTSASASKRSAMLDLAKSELPIASHHEVLDKNPHLINCLNGTLDLRTCELRLAHRNDMITKCLPVIYDFTADCPLWIKFLNRVIPDQEIQMFLQKSCGVALSGITQQSLLFLYGSGANGKSTFVETVLALLDEYASKTDAETLLLRDRQSIPNDKAALVGKRLVVASELPDGRRLNEAMIKDLTGGDTISARFLHKEFFTFKPEFKLWMYGNHKPVITGTDEGIWRRMRLIPFTVQIPENERDPHLTTKLKEELPGILAWCVRGWVMYQQDGMKPPKAVIEATNDYRSESDIVGQFLDECTISGMSYEVPKSDLYSEYKQWCNENGFYPLSQNRLSKTLTERDFISHKNSKGHIWRGLGLLSMT